MERASRTVMFSSYQKPPYAANLHFEGSRSCNDTCKKSAQLSLPVGLDRARAIHEGQGCSLAWSPASPSGMGLPTAPHPPSWSPRLVDEAGLLDVSRPCASPPLALPVARWRPGAYSQESITQLSVLGSGRRTATTSASDFAVLDDLIVSPAS